MSNVQMDGPIFMKFGMKVADTFWICVLLSAVRMGVVGWL